MWLANTWKYIGSPQIQRSNSLRSQVRPFMENSTSDVPVQGHHQSSHSPAACLEHRLNTNQTSFTAGFIWGSWETVPACLLAMVTRDSFQRCHGALSSQQLIHSPPPSGSLRFCPFPVQTLQSPSRAASWKENIPYLSSARIMRHCSGFQAHALAQVRTRAPNTFTNTCTFGMLLIDFNAVEKQMFSCKGLFSFAGLAKDSWNKMHFLYPKKYSIILNMIEYLHCSS